MRGTTIPASKHTELFVVHCPLPDKSGNTRVYNVPALYRCFDGVISPEPRSDVWWLPPLQGRGTRAQGLTVEDLVSERGAYTIRSTLSVQIRVIP